MHTLLIKSGLRTKLHKLYNEASQILSDKVDTLNIDWQPVTPQIHWQNIAKRAIQT